ncbi:dihydrofolate reductase [Aquabacter spiritensis]|uniref:Dihydrofolate reductase n=1 Tax=Aquabacter spiritensis TaxID=933073 RepID=A0A4R3M2G1_9HYPH|nr:dihydrofolate reductase [Aquabacter spiritensis]TCT06843.1 dihydrofolate reductase [Aquabacter spiritensis]
MLPLAHIVAMAENGVIGRGDALPFRLPSDLKRFRALTWGKPILMGRRTFQSIGRVLPGRISVVVSADPGFVAPEGVYVGRTLDAALALADAAGRDLGAPEIMVIGGRRVFAETLPLTRIVHLTQVHAAPEGDVFLTPYDPSAWRETGREGPLQGAGDEAPFTYLTLERAAARAESAGARGD